jgi:hypothetical protein
MFSGSCHLDFRIAAYYPSNPIFLEQNEWLTEMGRLFNKQWQFYYPRKQLIVDFKPIHGYLSAFAPAFL